MTRARNTHVSRSRVVQREQDLDFSGDSEVDVTINGLRSIEDIEDVSAYGFGSGDSNSDEGRAVEPVAVSGNVVTLHSYVTGGSAGSAFDDDTATVDEVIIEAEGS